MLLVISGPSGCGKTTLVKKMLSQRNDLVFSISHTTRKKRDSELHGSDYYFVSAEEFERKIAGDAFAEWAKVHGFYYGTSREEIAKRNDGKGLILDVDIQGAKQIKARYPEALLVFIFPPLFQELKQRLLSRGDETEDSINKRLNTAKKEILSFREFDYLIINDRLEKAERELMAVITSARCRANSQQEEVERILLSFSEGN
jgi:guanylate kinase